MKLQEPLIIRAKVVTPLFIGDGESVTPLSYIVEGKRVYVVDVQRFLRALSPEGQAAYLAWIDPQLNQIANLETQIDQAYRSKNFDLRRELNRERRDAEGKLSLDTFVRHHLRIQNVPAFIQATGSVLYDERWNVNPRNEGFRSFIKTADHRPYVPGTELKGAWRTALLFMLTGEPAVYATLENALDAFRSEILRSGRSPRDKAKQLAHIDGKVEEEAFRGKEDDAKYDLLRLLQIGDSDRLSPDVLRVRALESVGTQRFTRTFAEALEPETTFTFRLVMANTAEMGWALDKLKLREKANAAISKKKLLEATYLRSQAILEADAAYFRHDAQMQREIAQLQTLNTRESPLLRLGMGQGFLSTTVDLQVRERDADLYDEAIREGVSLQRKWRTMRDNFPKTRRTVSDGRRNPETVPGWVKLQIIEG